LKCTCILNILVQKLLNSSQHNTYMGATQSVITTEEFKNYLYGTVVLMLSPRMAEVQFKECSKITDEDQRVLPMVIDTQPKDLDGIIQAYCQYYGASGKEDAIDTYVQNNILDSDEHIQAFMKHLVGLLQERRSQVDASIRRLAPSHRSVPVQSMRSSPIQAQKAPVSVPPAARQVPWNEAASGTDANRQPMEIPSSPAPTQSVHRIHGHGRLQRRLKNVDQAINQETIAYQRQQVEQQRQQVEQQRQQQQLELEHVAENVEEAYQPPEPEDIQELQEYVQGAEATDGSADLGVYDEDSTVDDTTQEPSGPN
jgi:hypothetical protein